jgi:hypothetical protein
VEGLVEAVLTSVVATALMASLPRFHASALMGLKLLRGKNVP